MGLKVPLADLTHIFTRPLKGLLAMAYAVTGAPGSLSISSDGISVPDAQLESTDPEIGGQVYHYVVQGGLAFDAPSVVAPKLGRKACTVSDTGTGNAEFKARLIERDRVSRYYPRRIAYHCVACHLIPFKRDPEAVKYILGNRPAAYDGRPRVMFQHSHEDVKNGILMDKSLQDPLDTRVLVLIQTPSRYLNANDIRSPTTPDAPQRFEPDAQRWTWVWLDNDIRDCFPEIVDAPFDRDAYKTNPHPVLLDYIFGAAVLTRWGFKADALLDPERGPVFAAPAKGQGTQRNRGSLSHDEGRIRSRAVSRSENHGMSLEQAEVLMAVLAARTPTGRAYAKAQQDKETAARASIESWVQSTHASYTDEPPTSGCSGTAPHADE